MRHPFDGIITPNETGLKAGEFTSCFTSTTKKRNRRSFFRLVAVGITGLIGFLFGSRTNLARGDQMDVGVAARRGGVTTQALREEGGGVTTQAIGEEGGRPRPPRPRPRPTTYALGEEGAGRGFPNARGPIR